MVREYADYPLEDQEILLSDLQEVLFRQVHPSFVQDGVPSSQAFRPMGGDRKLSHRRGSLITAESAYDDHQALGHSSSGTLGVSVAEVANEGLRAVDDSAMADVPSAHSYVDYRGIAPAKSKSVAKRLKHSAMARGWLYRPAGE